MNVVFVALVIKSTSFLIVKFQCMLLGSNVDSGVPF